MRLVTCLLRVLAAVASAQSPGDASYSRELAVAHLSADLANLKTLPRGPLLRSQCPVRDPKVQRPEECGPLDRVREDLTLGRDPRSIHLPTGGLAYNLVDALAGRELEPDALSLLSNSFVDAIAIADRAVEVRTRASSSQAFRDSVMRAYAAMFALGVDRNRAERFLGTFVREAEQFSRPPDFVPIPPARPF